MAFKEKKYKYVLSAQWRDWSSVEADSERGELRHEAVHRARVKPGSQTLPGSHDDDGCTKWCR